MSKLLLGMMVFVILNLFEMQATDHGSSSFHPFSASIPLSHFSNLILKLKYYILYQRSYRHIPLVEQITKLPDLVLCLLSELLTISFVEHLQVAGEATRVSPNFHAPNSREQQMVPQRDSLFERALKTIHMFTHCHLTNVGVF